jgi:outer membrane protein
MKKIVLAILVIVLVIGVTLCTTYFTRKEKLAYINTSLVYEGFNLKKEMETKYNRTQEARKLVLDSLMQSLQAEAKALEENDNKDKESILRFESLRKSYAMKKKQFDEDNESLASSYTSQVWEQLNQYIKDFGTENEYKFIFGATGQGNLMYANDADDITKMVIAYANDKYEGKKAK